MIENLKYDIILYMIELKRIYFRIIEENKFEDVKS